MVIRYSNNILFFKIELPYRSTSPLSYGANVVMLVLFSYSYHQHVIFYSFIIGL